MTGNAISLHIGEFFLVWTQMGLGEPPTVLAIEHLGRTTDARAQYAQAAGEAMTERGLGTVERPDAQLAGLLRMVADAPLRVEMIVEDPEYTARAIGATKGADAVELVRFGTEIRLIPMHADELPGVLLEATRPLDPGPGTPANVQVSAYQRACAAGESDGTAAFEDALVDSGVRGQEAATITHAIGERVGGGRLTAMSAHDGGPWQRADAPVSWVDTAAGRYALRRREGWLMVTPVDHARLVAMATELLAPLAEDAPDPLDRWT